MDLEEESLLEGDIEDLNSDSDDSQAGSNEVSIEGESYDEEEQHFDITLAASHSYMGEALTDMGGRVLLEAGWTGTVPVLCHHGVVFPGETVPMLLNEEHDSTSHEFISRAITGDKLFGLLCPDETGQSISGYGVLCEVYEAALEPGAVSCKARALHRFRLVEVPKQPPPAAAYRRARRCAVRVLPEVVLAPPLRRARPAGPPPAGPPGPGQALVLRLLRRLEAVVSPWPDFVFEIFDYTRMRNIIRDYFHTVGLEKMLPEDPVSLSFWVASNLTVAPRDRLALLVVDNVLLRLHMECQFIDRRSILCCTACGAETARRENVFAMSSDGVHSNYTNPGGFVHDVVTVSRVVNTSLSGAPEPHYSWFPGYAWTVAQCARCSTHVGWRFTALRRSLRPVQFYGLCRNYVQPREVGGVPGRAGGPRPAL